MNSRLARLLVVDDDPVTLDLLKEVLSKEGHEVRVALGGEDAPGGERFRCGITDENG
jgi:CheY-like chemotaxis protein